MVASRSTSLDTSIFSTSPQSILYGGFLPPGHHSLVGAYRGASSSNSSSNMSAGVINPTNEGLASEQVINMSFVMLVIHELTQQVGIIHLGATIVSSAWRTTFWWTLPCSYGENPHQKLL